MQHLAGTLTLWTYTWQLHNTMCKYHLDHSLLQHLKVGCVELITYSSLASHSYTCLEAWSSSSTIRSKAKVMRFTNSYSKHVHVSQHSLQDGLLRVCLLITSQCNENLVLQCYFWYSTWSWSFHGCAITSLLVTIEDILCTVHTQISLPQLCTVHKMLYNKKKVQNRGHRSKHTIHSCVKLTLCDSM